MADPFKDDPTFLSRYREGVAEALDRVYRAYARPLRHFVVKGFAFKSDGRDLYFRGVSAEYDLEDIIQETFRRAFGLKARESYDGVRPFKNYLFTIARNAVINDILLKARHIPVGDAFHRDTPFDESATSETWAMNHRIAAHTKVEAECGTRVENLEICGLIGAFVGALDREQAQFFQLRFLGLCSQEDTARRMGWKRSRVRKVEARLRASFLCHIQGTGYLDQRPETQRVRRATDPTEAHRIFQTARQLWRSGRAHDPNDFMIEAA
ncbi:MAG: sigma-70 family RNA polymerase sigma factor [Deltaproteobacteria bacterium]|nr:sigma-70 family RNA polymerase sigma factor [Deltaproteobacteria bacterium]